MKRKLLKTVTALTAAAMLSGGVTVYASIGHKAIDAVFSNIKVIFNGQKLELTTQDEEGNTAEPFIADGIVYLPVNAVGEALGAEVVWDEDNGTITITPPVIERAGVTAGEEDETAETTEEEETAEAINLADMDYFARSFDNDDFWYNESSIAINTGDNINNFVGFFFGYDRTGEYTVDYLINEKYSTFTGDIALLHEYRSTTNVLRLKIYGDDKLLYTSPEVKAGFLPESFEVDVTGVKVLRIGYEEPTNNYDNSGYTGFGIGNAMLHPAE